jgi:site-specific recombinase XerD
VELENYLAARRGLLGNVVNNYLLANHAGRGLNDNRVRLVFDRAVGDIGLEQPRQIIGNANISSPTPHSLRHAFAVNTLNRVKKRGGSAQKTLTILGKGNKFRLIKLAQKTTDLVTRYITQYRPHPKPIHQHWLFINKHGRPLTRKGIYLLCQNYLAIALKPNRLQMIHPVHSFRHACAINMLASGKSLSDIKNHLGHENIESTMIYLKMDLRTKRAVQKKFIEYSQSTLKHDPKIDELIDWEHKKATLAWLDSL